MLCQWSQPETLSLAAVFTARLFVFTRITFLNLIYQTTPVRYAEIPKEESC